MTKLALIEIAISNYRAAQKLLEHLDKCGASSVKIGGVVVGPGMADELLRNAQERQALKVDRLAAELQTLGVDVD